MAHRYRIHHRKGTTYKRAGKSLIPVNKAIIGEWNFIDDRTGFKCKSSEATITWDGYLTSNDIDEPRTPQDFVRAVRDQKPLPPQLVRPDTELNFKTTSEEDLINSLLNK